MEIPVTKVALWLGDAIMRATEIYLRADPTKKLEVLESIVTPTLRSQVNTVQSSGPSISGGLYRFLERATQVHLYCTIRYVIFKKID